MILSTSILGPSPSSLGRMTSGVMGTVTVVASVLTRRSRTDIERVEAIGLQLVHVGEEFGVVANLLKTADEKFHCLGWRHRNEHFAEDPDALEVFLRDEELFLSGAGALDVDGREDALIDELAVKNDFHVAGALEFFKDDFVHAGAGIDECGGDDSERAAFLDVAGRAEEALG